MAASTIATPDRAEPLLRSVPGFARSHWPRHESDELEAVVAVLADGRTNSLVHGEETKAFEREFAEFVGMPHAIAVANGTLALELALRALGIGPGDEVIVPARSFFATTSAVVAIGATPVFADVEPDTQNIDPRSVARVVGPETRAVVCVHLAGQPCDMDGLAAVCEQHGLLLVEDCAQAHGARWNGRVVGSFGDAGCFSFCTDKIMSTGGEGGMVVLRDEAVWRRAWAYKDHGKDPVELAQPSPAPAGEFRFCHSSFGSNFRMTEMQAAIGRAQLRKLPAWLKQRRRNAQALMDAACRHPAIARMHLPAQAEHAFYKCYLRLKPDALHGSVDRPAILAMLHADGIACGSGSCPDMSREGAFAGVPARKDRDLPAAHDLGRHTIMFPVDHTLDEEGSHAIGARLVEVIERLESAG
ncbi:DegT/DnrJ/EryC1/StrS family aminotransferase [Qipengyuania sp. XHP0207]|uniref:DegT/DnrJ/EryC1/StrS family aminotransferase n=1 Tax=Qipengyuania sp. XHP0207 TaxID=3038078 RepID=UPI00241F42C4|nr:DegT/DnrJ/EryC1/StrS family aminotransferase [Qipengyuania sp. XHP0207]MDG5747725.1 DegT/DnrJ/EryC1/StrS family aminotransferase [Qipengyuania sp. XHP0207]